MYENLPQDISLESDSDGELVGHFANSRVVDQQADSDADPSSGIRPSSSWRRSRLFVSLVAVAALLSTVALVVAWLRPSELAVASVAAPAEADLHPERLFLDKISGAFKKVKETHESFRSKMCGESLLFKARPVASTGSCADRPPWWSSGSDNGRGYTYDQNRTSGGWNCDAYRNWGWCANGATVEGSKGLFGAEANFPEQSCCICGGGGSSKPSEQLLTKLFEELGKTKVIDGVTDLLGDAAKNAVALCSVAGGFSTNEAIRIVVPPEISNAVEKIFMISARIEKITRQSSNSSLQKAIDNLEVAMNKAAEMSSDVASEAVYKVIKDTKAIISMSKNINLIWAGGNESATQFLEWATHHDLAGMLVDPLTTIIEKTGVVEQYGRITGIVRANPLWKECEAHGLVIPDIIDYMVQQTLAGIFTIMKKQEAILRQHPEKFVMGDSGMTSKFKAVFETLAKQRTYVQSV